jgi:hypothetical protein
MIPRTALDTVQLLVHTTVCAALCSGVMAIAPMPSAQSSENDAPRSRVPPFLTTFLDVREVTGELLRFMNGSPRKILENLES